MKRVSVEEIGQIAFYIAQEKFSFNEPIPAFSTRFSNVLESCLETPFQSFGGNDLYPTFVGKVSILFYLMNKNHPFQNGNKRVAMTTLFYCLHENQKWLRVDTQTLYNFAVWVAESPSGAKKQVVDYIEQFLHKHMVPLEN